MQTGIHTVSTNQTGFSPHHPFRVILQDVAMKMQNLTKDLGLKVKDLKGIVMFSLGQIVSGTVIILVNVFSFFNRSMDTKTQIEYRPKTVSLFQVYKNKILKSDCLSINQLDDPITI